MDTPDEKQNAKTPRMNTVEWDKLKSQVAGKVKEVKLDGAVIKRAKEIITAGQEVYGIPDDIKDSNLPQDNPSEDRDTTIIHKNTIRTDSDSIQSDPPLIPRRSGSSSVGEVEVLGEGSRSSSEVEAVVEDGDLLGPERSVAILIKSIQEDAIDSATLTVDERRYAVKYLRGQGRIQDEIAAILKTSRRTIVRDYKVLREMETEEVSKLTTYDIGGEVYALCQSAANKAMVSKEYRTVAKVLKDMIDMLQSLGIMYRAPTKAANITGHFGISKDQAVGKYLDSIGQDRDKVVAVLSGVMDSIEAGSCDIEL